MTTRRETIARIIATLLPNAIDDQFNGKLSASKFPDDYSPNEQAAYRLVADAILSSDVTEGERKGLVELAQTCREAADFHSNPEFIKKYNDWADLLERLDGGVGRMDQTRIADGGPICAKCGAETNGEVALVNNSEWCHPCADTRPSEDGKTKQS